MSGVDLSRQIYEAINSGAAESRFSELRRAGAQCEATHFASAASAADDGVLGALWNVWPEMKVPQQAYEQIALEANSGQQLARLFSEVEKRTQLDAVLTQLIDTVLPFLFEQSEALRQQAVDFLCEHGRTAEILRQHGQEYDQFLPPDDEEEDDDDDDEEQPEGEQ